MTGKVLDGKSAGILVLILPLGVGLVLLYRAWLYILVMIGIVLAWNVWENYQWQQWSLQINPLFNQLIQENQGCLTAVDLSLKGNLTANSARKFLERKADEFGAYRRSYQDKGTVYYFITASTLGKIFDESERTEKEAPTPTLAASTLPIANSSTFSEPEKPVVSPFSHLAEIKEERQPVSKSFPDAIAEVSPIPEVNDFNAISNTESSQEVASEIQEVEMSESVSLPTLPETTSQALTLIQADLAKRLDTTSSTIARRKTEADFADWSLSKDPDGLAWSYHPDTKLFVAII